MKFLLLSVFLLSAIAQAAPIAEFEVCYDFGCKSKQSVDFNETQWHSIRQIFTPPADNPLLEKQQIRRAIALMEQYSGEIVGTAQDQGGNYNGVDIPFQQDCIDESTNTTHYLQALQRRNLFKWHQVTPRERRIRWLFTHWTAVIQQINSGELFAVDSWYRDNGEPPYIQKLEDWRRKLDFPTTLNPD